MGCNAQIGADSSCYIAFLLVEFRRWKLALILVSSDKDAALL